MKINTLGKMLLASLFVMLFADAAMAQAAANLSAEAGMSGRGWAGLGAGLAAGLAVIGAGMGIGKIGASSCESTARQPEMAGRIFINMILTAALIEGVALFAVVVGFLKFPAFPAF